MPAYFEIGFSDPVSILIGAVLYLVALGVPLAISYVSTGFVGPLIKQLRLTAVVLIVLISGGFFFYAPSLSYVAVTAACASFLASVRACVNRHKIEKL